MQNFEKNTWDEYLNKNYRSSGTQTDMSKNRNNIKYPILIKDGEAFANENNNYQKIIANSNENEYIDTKEELHNGKQGTIRRGMGNTDGRYRLRSGVINLKNKVLGETTGTTKQNYETARNYATSNNIKKNTEIQQKQINSTKERYNRNLSFFLEMLNLKPL